MSFFNHFFQVVDGQKYEGCNAQSGWGKMCAKSFTGSEREGSACPGDSGSPLVRIQLNLFIFLFEILLICNYPTI